MTRFSSIVLLSCAFCWLFLTGTLAVAQDVVVVQSGSYGQGARQGTSFEVAGFRLGMLADKVKSRAAQEASQSPPRLSLGTLTLSRGTTIIHSQVYLKGLQTDIGGVSGRLRVTFGAPSIGGRVVALAYSRYYFDIATAPTLTGILEDFETKYGKSDREQLVPPDELATREDWIFATSGLVPCGGGRCLAGYASDLDDIPHLRDSTTHGERVIVSVFVIAHKNDPSRAESVSIEIEDVANELLGLTEAQKQLEAALPNPP